MAINDRYLSIKFLETSSMAAGHFRADEFDAGIVRRDGVLARGSCTGSCGRRWGILRRNLCWGNVVLTIRTSPQRQNRDGGQEFFQVVHNGAFHGVTFWGWQLSFRGARLVQPRHE